MSEKHMKIGLKISVNIAKKLKKQLVFGCILC